MIDLEDLYSFFKGYMEICLKVKHCCRVLHKTKEPLRVQDFVRVPISKTIYNRVEILWHDKINE